MTTESGHMVNTFFSYHAQDRLKQRLGLDRTITAQELNELYEVARTSPVIKTQTVVTPHGSTEVREIRDVQWRDIDLQLIISRNTGAVVTVLSPQSCHAPDDIPEPESEMSSLRVEVQTLRDELGHAQRLLSELLRDNKKVMALYNALAMSMATPVKS